VTVRTEDQTSVTAPGLSAFGVLEILLHKGPLPVNTIGPIVDLTPGSISMLSTASPRKVWLAGSRAPRTGACGSLLLLRVAKTSLLMPSGSMPDR